MVLPPRPDGAILSSCPPPCLAQTRAIHDRQRQTLEGLLAGAERARILNVLRRPGAIVSYATWCKRRVGSAVRPVFPLAIGACWALVAAVWIAGAVYNMVKGPHARTWSRGQAAWIVAAVGFYLLAPHIPQWTAREFRVPTGVRLAGLALLAAATAFTLWARSALGRMWSSTPMVKEGHELRTSGPYGITRHPIYTGFIGMLLGSALASGIVMWGFVTVLVIALFSSKIRTEERLMTAEFPEAYPSYRRRVPQLVPGLKRLAGQAGR